MRFTYPEKSSATMLRPAAMAVVVVMLVSIISASAIPQPGRDERRQLNIARYGHTASALADGRVLIVGGRAGESLIALSEIRLADGEVAIGPRSIHPREHHSATLLSDGRLLIAGGNDGALPLDTTELYDAQLDAFVLGPRMNVARSGHTAVRLVDGRVVVVGGDAKGTIEILDVHSQTFRIAATASSARQNHSSIALKDGRILTVGGTDASGKVLRSAEIFDPKTETTIAIGDMKSPRKAPALKVLIDGKVQIIGGNGNHATLEMFNPLAFFTAQVNLPKSVWKSNSATSSVTVSSGETSLTIGGRDANGQPTRSISVNETASEAWVTTDKTDYPPGEVVTITGGGYAPGETIDISITRDPETSEERQMTFTSIADENGNFTNTEFITLIEDIGASFLVVATGASSNRVAFTSFTDGNASVYTTPASVPTVTITYEKFSSSSSCAGSPSSSSSVAVSVHTAPTAVALIGVDNNQSLRVTTTVPNGFSFVNWTTSPATTITNSTSPTACVAGMPANFRIAAAFIASDSTPPVSTANFDAPNANGWHNANVTVSLSASDNVALGSITYSTTGAQTVSATTTSGSSASLTISAEGTTTVSYYATDAAGNVETPAHSITIKLDKTKPTLTFDAASPAANANGWNNSDVSFGYSASDSLSGVDSSSPASPVVLSAEGASVSESVTVTDLAGNSDTFATPAVKIDKTKPTLTFDAASPAANANGWNNSDVSFGYTASDALSGIASSTPVSPVVLSAEGASVNDSVTVTDLAGNSDSFTTPSVKIDKTAPTIDATRSPDASGAGWNNTDVTASYTASDALSGLASAATGSHTFSTEGSGQTHTFTVTDQAGNSSSATISGVNIDKTGPNVSATPDRPANGHGWYNGDVTVSFTATDGGSGLASCSEAATLSANAADQSATGSCSDVAGNTSSATLSGINIDKISPTATASTDRDSNAAGWYNADVTVTFSGSDALSGIATCTASATLGEGAGQSSSGTCSDKAGNESNTASVSGINIDKTAPTIDASRTPDPNGAGWNNSDVTASYVASDGLSGLNGSSPSTGSFVFSADGANQSHEFTVTDLAGNSSSATISGVNIDKTAPTVTATADRSPNTSGWYNADVVVTFAASDGGSGIVSCSEQATLSASAANQSATGSCTDAAGNNASATLSGINIDKVKPTASASTNADPNAAGWYNADVTVTFTGADDLSGLAGCTTEAVLGEGAGQSASGTCTDVAGNVSDPATASGINIDKTAPSISANRAPAANDFGWNNTDVTASYNASDALSGLDASSPSSGDYIFSVEGASLAHTFTVTDLAGNSSNATISNVNIDKTAPGATASAGTFANSYGWYNEDVIVTFEGSDSGAGIDSCSAPVTLTASAANQSASGSCTDKAGNTSATATLSGINIDKVKPSATASTDRAPNAAGWYNADVTVTFSGSDALSGIASCTTPSILAEGAPQSASGSCTDKAGNESDLATASGINIDKTAPSISADRTPSANANGWNNSDVTASYTASDALSGLDGSSPASGSHLFSAEGAGQSKTFTVTDVAGNSSSAVISNVNIDKTAPSITSSRAPLANAAGWNNTNVVASYNANDALSGLPSGTQSGSYTFSSEGLAQSYTFNVTDLAGNSASSSVTGVSIDKSAPVLTLNGANPAQFVVFNPYTDAGVTIDANISGLASSSSSNTINTNLVGSYTYTYNASDNAGNSASITRTVNVTPQTDAYAEYTGALYVSTASQTSNKATISLAATITDPAGPGDVRTARLQFWEVTSSGETMIKEVPIGLVSVGNTLVGTASYNWDVTLSGAQMSAGGGTFAVRLKLVGNYTWAEPAPTTINVAVPGDNSINGGGYLSLTSSSGQYAGQAGTKNNFGFNVKFNKSGTNLQGNINTIVRNNGRVYQIKGNSMTSLSVKTAGSPRTATFNGKASIQDITDPLNPISVDGNATLQVTLSDFGEPGSNDTISITVWNKTGGLWFASNWNGSRTIEQKLAGGNLSVR